MRPRPPAATVRLPFPALIVPCFIPPRQKKSKISASRKLQLKVPKGLEGAPRCPQGVELEGWEHGGGASDGEWAGLGCGVFMGVACGQQPRYGAEPWNVGPDLEGECLWRTADRAWD